MNCVRRFDGTASPKHNQSNIPVLEEELFASTKYETDPESITASASKALTPALDSIN
jgi:hypothetical protein